MVNNDVVSTGQRLTETGENRMVDGGWMAG
jgi:hypothetical protein